MTVRHFLTLNDLSADELHAIIDRAIELKRLHRQQRRVDLLQGRVLAMLFEASSTRTRVSFEAGMAQLGGHALYLSPETTQLGRGEPYEDTARVLSGMVDAVMIRTFEHDKIEAFARVSSVPVINGLSDAHHPCQLLADIQTYIEHRGSMRGKTVVWLGDGNNMCHSYITAAKICDFHLKVSCPDEYMPDADIVRSAGDNVSLFHQPAQAIAGADLVVTDAWASMGHESEYEQRVKAFRQFQVNTDLMERANKDALFMHCLPVYRGEEVTGEVIDGDQSVVWDEAANRLHAQKALLEFLMIGDSRVHSTQPGSI